MVLDSVGVGALSDAGQYGDSGSDTLGNTARRLGGLVLPALERLGLGCLHRIEGVVCPREPLACYGKMAEAGAGKDTTVGHWEIAGVITERPFPTYPNGFPQPLMREFERRIGRCTLGNKPASGTAIIEELGAAHLRTGFPIVYTSADSVFQIAAHQDVIALEALYEICKTARELLQGEHGVGRVIARPFTGVPGHFLRTAGRRDFGLEPPRPTLLDLAAGAGHPVVGVGKIGDVFVHRGLTREVKTPHNVETMRALLDETTSGSSGLLLVNLVDFDMLYGHRNDVQGFADALARFDAFLPCLLTSLKPGDALFITADHGCDPTTGSTDHSREHVPLLCHGRRVRSGVDLGTRASFADLGATVGELLRLGPLGAGESFAAAILA